LSLRGTTTSVLSREPRVDLSRDRIDGVHLDAIDETRRGCVSGRIDGVWAAPDAIDATQPRDAIDGSREPRRRSDGHVDGATVVPRHVDAIAAKLKFGKREKKTLSRTSPRTRPGPV
jgi:hypothetical protein